MLPSFAIQKLERYAQFALKKDSMEKFVAASLKDATNANIYSLTHVASWVDAADALANRRVQVSSSLLQAIGCGCALLHGALSSDRAAALLCSEARAGAGGDGSEGKSLRTTQADGPDGASAIEALSTKALDLVRQWQRCLSSLTRDIYGDSLQHTEAMGSTVTAIGKFFLHVVSVERAHAQDEPSAKRSRGTPALMELSPSAVAEMRGRLEHLLSVALNRWRAMWLVAPAPKMFHVPNARTKCPTLATLCDVADVSESLLDTVAGFLAPVVATEGAKFFVFYRGDSDRVQTRLNLRETVTSAAGGSSGASTAAAHTHQLVSIVTNAHEQLLLLSGPGGPINSGAPVGAAPSAAQVTAATASWRSWLRMHSVVFMAFCREGSWVELGKEQKRLAIARDADRSKGKQSRREREAARQERRARREGSVAGSMSDATSSSGVRTDDLKAKQRRNTVADAQDDDDDDDDLRSVKSSYSAAGSANSDARSFLSEVMSHFSAASAYSAVSVASVATTMSMMPLAEEEERQAHDSEDGNTNLPLILLEMMCQSIYDFLDRLMRQLGDAFPDIVAAMHVDGWREVGRLFQCVNSLMRDVMGTAAASGGNAYARSLQHADDALLLGADGDAQVGIFSLPDDLRFNHARGYQVLGSILGRMLLPALKSEYEVPSNVEEGAPPAADAAGGAADGIGKLTRFLPRALFSTILARCLRVYETVASQIINIHIKPILLAVVSGIDVEMPSTDDVSVPFLCDLCARFGRTNQTVVLLEALVDIAWPGLMPASRRSAAAALEADGTATAAIEAAAAGVESIDRIKALINVPAFRVALRDAVEMTMDTEALLAFVATVCQRALKPFEGSRGEAMDHIARVSAVLHLAAAVQGAVDSTPLVALAVIEHAAELDVTLCVAVISIREAYLCEKEEEVASTDETVAKEEAEPLFGALKMHKPSVRSAVEAAFTAALTLLLATRRSVLRCFRDMGLDDPEAFFAALEDSLWNVTSAIGAVCGPLGADELAESVADSKVVYELVLQRLTLGYHICNILDRRSDDEAGIAASKAMVKFVIAHHECGSSPAAASAPLVAPLTADDLRVLSFHAPKVVAKFLRATDAAVASVAVGSADKATAQVQRAWLSVLNGAGESLLNAAQLIGCIASTVRTRGGLVDPLATFAAVLPVACKAMTPPSCNAALTVAATSALHDIVAVCGLSQTIDADATQTADVFLRLVSFDETVLPLISAAAAANHQHNSLVAAQLIARLLSAATKQIAASGVSKKSGDQLREAVRVTIASIVAAASARVKKALKGTRSSGTRLSVTMNDDVGSDGPASILVAVNVIVELMTPRFRSMLTTAACDHSELGKLVQRVASLLCNLIGDATSGSAAPLVRSCAALLIQVLAGDGRKALLGEDGANAVIEHIVSCLAPADDLDATTSTVQWLARFSGEGWHLVWLLAREAAASKASALFSAILKAERSVTHLAVPPVSSLGLLSSPVSADTDVSAHFRAAFKQRITELIAAALSSSEPASFSSAARVILAASGVQGVKLVEFKTLVAEALAIAASESALPETVAAALSLTHNPLPSFHTDSSFVAVELGLIAVVMQRMAGVGGATSPLSIAATAAAVSPGSTERRAALRTCFLSAVQTLSLLAAKFPKQMQSNLHVVAPLIAPLTRALLVGLEGGLFDAVVANAVSALMYHLTRRELLSGPRVFHQAAFQSAAFAAAHFTAGAASLDSFTRFSLEVDSCSRDICNALLRGKPAHGTVPPVHEAPNHFSELAYSCIPSTNGKSLLKKAVLRATEEGEGAMTTGHVSFTVGAL